MPPPEFTLYVQPVLQAFLSSLWLVWSKVWWIALPFITFFFAWDFWNLYIHYRFLVAIKWMLLEIKVPKNVLKTPKAMEQIFAAAYAPYSYGFRWLEIHWEGLLDHSMSFEIVGSAGESHFYLRLPRQYRNLMESAIYAQFPEAEITEVEDYVKLMPRIIPNKTFEVYGQEMMLKKES